MNHQNNSIKSSSIQKSLIKTDIKKGDTIISSQYIKEMRRDNGNNQKDFKESKILSNAYKKVINVISNFFDDKDNEENKKTKLNHQISQKTFNSIINKKRIKEKFSYNQPKRFMFLSKISSKYINSRISEVNEYKKYKENKKTSIHNFNVPKYKSEKLLCTSKKELLNKNYKQLIIDDEIKNEIKKRIKRFSAFNKNKIEKKSKKNIQNSIQKSFFRPKNKLKFRFGFRKSALIPRLFKNANENKKFGTNKNKEKINIENFVIKTNSNKKLNFKETIKPFNSIQQKLNINIDTKSIKQKLYDYENNEITNQINKLPENIPKKDLVKRKALPVRFESKSIHINPFKTNFIKAMNQYNKEKKYRILCQKNAVYDSLDDEETFDRCINDNFYFEPNSTFLYFLDSIIFIFSLIILIYLPIFLAKNLYFCKSITDVNSIIFYIIDLFYVLDLIINFYRAYYNFDENLITDKNRIFLHYIKTWFLVDFFSSLPIYFFFRYRENKCIEKNIYYDSNLNNRGIHSSNYNISPYNMHYLLMLIKVFKSFKTFKKNIAVEKIVD